LGLREVPATQVSPVLVVIIRVVRGTQVFQARPDIQGTPETIPDRLGIQAIADILPRQDIRDFLVLVTLGFLARQASQDVLVSQGSPAKAGSQGSVDGLATIRGHLDIQDIPGSVLTQVLAVQELVVIRDTRAAPGTQVTAESRVTQDFQARLATLVSPVSPATRGIRVFLATADIRVFLV
jgi:hypothetical protein